jgi:glycosyltransferase involved in cell wall biosynthesis
MNNNISCLLTIHNKEWLIGRVIDGITENMSELVTEIVIVFDGCKDNSEVIVKNRLEKIQNNISITYLYTDDVFETKANNTGLKAITNPYVISIQDDMVITEKNFDKRMLKPFVAFTDVFAVTAQTAHNNYFDGSTFHHIDDVNNPNRNSNTGLRNVFYIREIVNRGPVMYNMQDLRKLNFLDEEYAPYSYDDHDICYRAKKLLNKVSGLYWINYISQPSWGTGRNKNQDLSYRSHRKNELLIVSKHKDVICSKEKNNFDRILNDN